MIIANADDFGHWTGSDPFPAPDPTELQVWSAFTPELPEKFRPDGPTGHQFIPGKGLAELDGLRTELLQHVQDRWPGTVVTEDFHTWTARRPDGACLRVRLEPMSEYDRCCRHLLPEEMLGHRYGGRESVVWFVEPGLVNIRRALGARRLELAQVLADDEDGVRDALDSVSGVEIEAQGSTVVLEVVPGPVVVAWAPNSFRDHKGTLRWKDLTTKTPGRILDLCTGSSGALLRVEPGLYGFARGTHETDRWCVRWCVAQLARA